MKFDKYYDEYWKKRLEERHTDPIRSSIPKILVKYSTYGSILNQIPRGSKVLDIGCGNGNVSSVYRSRASEVVGVDISATALKDAAKRDIETIRWDLNDTPLPLKDGTFDIIIITDVLEHMINPNSLLTEARRLLQKNGKMIITVPNFARLNNRLRSILGDPIDILHREKYGDELEHLHWFTKPKLKYMLSRNSFRKIKFVPVGLPFGFAWGILGFNGLGNFLLVTALK